MNNVGSFEVADEGMAKASRQADERRTTNSGRINRRLVAVWTMIDIERLVKPTDRLNRRWKSVGHYLMIGCGGCKKSGVCQKTDWLD